MSEVRSTQVLVFEERLYCQCGKEMTFMNISYDSYPPRYPHKCENCGENTTEAKRYPGIVYKTIQEPTNDN